MSFYQSKFDKVKPQDKKTNFILTEDQITKVRTFFQDALCKNLNLRRVSAPLMVTSSSGFNDDLNGTERKIKIDLKTGPTTTIVHSLAKWKRHALKKYNFDMYSGLYTNMNALRIDEDLSNIHSYYVDQWDWEKVIKEEDRNIEYLKKTVKDIYKSLKETDFLIRSEYQELTHKLPEDIQFIFTQDLEDEYPDLDPKEREYECVKKHKAVFLMKIGGVLRSGTRHDGRAPDYDDWELNGDILLYNELLDIPYEISSMGIRVSKESLMRQLEEAGALDRTSLKFHSMLLNDELPFTIGGGIGQSRVCMFLLDKLHIGEVQVSEWDEKTKKYCATRNINLL
ncbi:asparagine synthetase a (ASNA) [Vairimorpha necatrix]|uniref:Asparagine synthetase a (ASNA) n=1 Tax=Vairimorpha necatrix TaxID=6039 RepID=A0AAX4JC41_9MICR